MSWVRPSHWPPHWLWIKLPEDNGDARLLETIWRMSEVTYKPPLWPHKQDIMLFLGDTPSSVPRDHTEGTLEDSMTLVAYVRLAKAALAAADAAALVASFRDDKIQESGA